MSAFIVSDDTIHRCVTAFDRVAASFKLDIPPNEIGEELKAMNREAVRARYDDADETWDMTPPPYVWHDGDYSDGEMWKALQCLLYQCAEGNVPEREMYGYTERVGEMIERGLTGDPIASPARHERAWAMTDRLPWDY
jgi:hypothetical protein